MLKLLISISESMTYKFEGKLFDYDIIYSLPELFFLFGFFVVFLFGIFRPKSQDWMPLVWVVVLGSLFLLVKTLPDINNVYYLYFFSIVKDYFLDYGKIFILVVFSVILAASYNWMKYSSLKNFEMIMLFLLSIFGSFLMISSYDFFMLYLAIELQSLCFYILAALRTQSIFSVEAGIKYFILGSFSSGLLLFGISFVYGFAGMLNFSELALLLVPYNLNLVVSDGIIMGIVFITIALLFKLGAVPFHMWLPDVYEGSPSIVTMFFITIPKISLIFVYIKLYHNLLGNLEIYWSWIFLICGLLSLFLGSFAALYQYKLKRLIAYSTISHVGFLLIGLSLNSFLGYLAVLFYLIVYVFIVLGFFLSIVLTRYSSDFTLLKTLDELRFLFNFNAFFVFLFSLVVFSNAGIPPLVGFFSKLFIMASLVQAKMYAILFFIILISVVSTVYYIRLIHMLFFSLSSKFEKSFLEFSQLDAFLIFNIQWLNIGLVIFPKFLFVLVFNWVLFFY